MTQGPEGSSVVMRGVWTTLGEPGTTSMLGDLGFDWIALDAQHGLWTDESVGAALRSRRNDRVPVHVRVRSLDAGLIGRALDAGASGVIVPLVSTVAQAQVAVSATRYPPLGQRSWGPFLGGYGREIPDPATANDAVSLAVMIETREGLENAVAIARTPGIDGLFVGPYDLAIALGVGLDELLADGGDDAPLTTVVRAASEAGITAGAFAGTPERAAVLASHGFRFLAVATDTLLLELGATAALG